MSDFTVTPEEKAFLEKRRAESSKGNHPSDPASIDAVIERVEKLSCEELSRLDPAERQDMVRRLSAALATTNR
jgi:hypothetical protein